MQEYLTTLKYILENGTRYENRTGVDSIGVFGCMMRFDLSKGFPAVTTKKLAWKSVVSELLWFLEGSTDERRLAEIHYEKPRNELVDKTTIWTANADKQGAALFYPNNETNKFLGPIYGFQWRNFGGYLSDDGTDQIEKILNQLKTDRDSRRIILSAWNPNDIDYMSLPPCHVLAQFRVVKNKLNCLMYQRSADMFLGVPFNIASYALLTHIFCSQTGLEPGELVHVLGDAHVYIDHVDQVRTQLSREPFPLPTLVMPSIPSLKIEAIKSLKVSDFKLENYLSHSILTAPMAV